MGRCRVSLLGRFRRGLNRDSLKMLRHSHFAGGANNGALRGAPARWVGEKAGREASCL